MNHASAITIWTARLVMLLALSLSVAIGLLTPYIIVVACLVLLGLTALDGTLWPALRAPGSVLLLSVVGALLVCFTVTARAPGDVLFIFNFVMLVLFVPLYAALERQRGTKSSLIVARLALSGALLSVIVILLMIGYFGGRRSTRGLIGVIVLSNTAVLLGFLALIGVATDTAWRRAVYLLGPVAGAATVIMTQSRGPLIALVPLCLFGAIFVARSLRASWMVVTGGLAAAFAATAFWVMTGGERMARLPEIFISMLSGDAIRDRTTVTRLDMYQAAWQAFLDAPFFGHGWARIIEAATPYLENKRLARLPQLHNDLADFSVAAGIVGALCYVALIIGPVWLAIASVRDSQYRLRVYGCLVLSTAYFCDGLTDLMFGFEFHTALYAVILAILLGYCRDPEVNKP